MTYRRVHRLLVRTRGLARLHRCSCGLPALDWAYQHTVNVLVEGGRKYSQDLTDYAPMCRGCHTRLDRLHDLVWGQTIRDHIRKIGSRPRTFEEQSKIGKLGMAAADATPAMRAHKKMISALNHTARRRCLICGMESVRTGLGRHQQVSGHIGYEDL